MVFMAELDCNNDSNGSVVYIEHLRHLNLISIEITLSLSYPDARQMELQVMHDKLWLTSPDKTSRKLLANLSQFTFPISLDKDVNERCKIDQRLSIGPSGEAKIEARIPVLASPTSTSSKNGSSSSSSSSLTAGTLEKPLNALQLKRAIDLQCKRCHVSLINQAPTDDININQIGDETCSNVNNNAKRWKRIVDLPSTYWFELVECWVCHPDDTKQPQHQQHIPDAMNNGKNMIAAEGVLVSANDCVYLHPSDIRSDKLNHSDHVKCGNCNFILGKQTPSNQFHLLKKGLSFSVLNKDDSVQRLECGEMDTVMYTLFEHSRAHATYKFLIRCKETHEPALMIWIRNWFTPVLVKPVDGQMNKLRGCVKFQYLSRTDSDIDSVDNGNDEFERMANEWLEDEKVESDSFELTEETLHAICGEMSAVNSRLPVEMQFYPPFKQSLYFHPTF